jgi:hypothetical protein
MGIAILKSKLSTGYDGLSLSGGPVALPARPRSCHVLSFIKPANQMLNVLLFCSHSLFFKPSVLFIRFVLSSFSSGQEYSFSWQIPGWIVLPVVTFLMCQPQ